MSFCVKTNCVHVNSKIENLIEDFSNLFLILFISFNRTRFQKSLLKSKQRCNIFDSCDGLKIQRKTNEIFKSNA